MRLRVMILLSALPLCGCGIGLYPVGSFSFTPDKGAPGTLVTLSGMDFSSARAPTVGWSQALLISQSAGSIAIFAMPGVVDGPITFTTSAGPYASPNSFRVRATPTANNQQGAKLLGSASVIGHQGSAVALSADGNTALIGGIGDNVGVGAAWVFTRSGTTWTQQGTKLVATDSQGAAQQGYAVALSADGNTALVGGTGDNGGIGAAWVYSRNGTTWSQQGTKLVGTGGVSPAQGSAVSLSADGNTALVGGNLDSAGVGATWVFTRNGSTWSQLGSKLVGSGGAGGPQQGFAVALSADASTAVIGAPQDTTVGGATWIFINSGSGWVQQGAKLLGTGNAGSAAQGHAVAVSADGNTILTTGNADGGGAGAIWAFTRSGGSWTQQGGKLAGGGNIGLAGQGMSVALSADGNVALEGGQSDNGSLGASWFFARSSGVWNQVGSKLVGTGAVSTAQQGHAVALSADGTTALVGGNNDNTTDGATWVFTP